VYDVPVAHLLHAVDHVLDVGEKQRKELRELCQSRDPGQRAAFEAQVNAADPDLLPRLQSVWSFATRHAVHLWTSRTLKKYDLGKLSPQELKKTYGGKVVDGVLVFPPGDEEVDVRVHRVRVTDQHGLDVEVRIVRRFAVPFEDEERIVERTLDVPIMVDLNRGERLVEVYAGYNEARKALVTFMEWLTGEEIPKRSGTKQKVYFEPLGFDEHNVRALAKRLKLKHPVSLRGPPPKIKAYGVQLWGGPEGSVDSLDFNDETIKLQDEQANKERWLPYPFAHDDGYKETTVVAFNFATKQPRVSFRLRTSRPAITHVLSELCKQVGRD
jgi:hypothetical protein